MKESQFQSRLLPALRRIMPQAEVWKMSDMWASGRPDVMVSYKGMCTFFELKCENRPLERIQLETLKRLFRGYVIRYKNKSYTVSHPSGIDDLVIMATFEELVAHLVKICRND